MDKYLLSAQKGGLKLEPLPKTGKAMLCRDVRLVMLYTIAINHLGPVFVLHFISLKEERREKPYLHGITS